MQDGLLNIEQLAKECLIAQGCDAQKIIENLKALKDKYNLTELTEIYNNFLPRENNPEVLTYIIKEMNTDIIC